MKIQLKKRNIKILLLVLILITVYALLKYSYTESNKLLDEIERQHRYSEYDDYVDELDYVDPFQSFLIKKREISHETKTGSCVEKRNFVFIKTMKCATQTLVQIFRRFGYLRHLNFVLPRGNNIYLGWPFILEKIDFRPSKHQFNIIAEHSVYNRTVMSKLMPKDAAYITIIREPFSHFKSTLNYFNVANISHVREADKLSGYLQNLERYEPIYKSPTAKLRYCIPDGFSVTKNLLSHCVGMPLGYPAGRENITNDLEKVRNYIQTIDSEFTLVMIMEYFHESLVLLKRLMCWSMVDILYHTSNVGNYAYKKSQPSEENLKIYKLWSHIDYLLYDHFNQTFWRKVEMEGDDFKQEVAEYNRIQSQVSEFCSNTDNSLTVLVIEDSPHVKSFSVSKDFCLVLGIDLLEYLKKRFDREEGWVEPMEDKNLPKRGC